MKIFIIYAVVALLFQGATLYFTYKTISKMFKEGGRYALMASLWKTLKDTEPIKEMKKNYFTRVNAIFLFTPVLVFMALLTFPSSVVWVIKKAWLTRTRSKSLQEQSDASKAFVEHAVGVELDGSDVEDVVFGDDEPPMPHESMK